MSLEVAQVFAVAATIVLGGAMPAWAIGTIGKSGLDAMGRNPEAAASVQSAMILSIAFAEAIAIYALVVALVLKFV